MFQVVSYHKHSSGRSSGLAVGQPLTHRLVVERLLAVVEGVVVEGVHQVGIDIAEEHAHLRGDRDFGQADCRDQTLGECTASFTHEVQTLEGKSVQGLEWAHRHMQQTSGNRLRYVFIDVGQTAGLQGWTTGHISAIFNILYLTSIITSHDYCSYHFICVFFLITFF